MLCYDYNKAFGHDLRYRRIARMALSPFHYLESSPANRERQHQPTYLKLRCSNRDLLIFSPRQQVYEVIRPSLLQVPVRLRIPAVIHVHTTTKQDRPSPFQHSTRRSRRDSNGSVNNAVGPTLHFNFHPQTGFANPNRTVKDPNETIVPSLDLTIFKNVFWETGEPRVSY